MANDDHAQSGDAGSTRPRPNGPVRQGPAGKGAYLIWVADRHGNLIAPPSDANSGQQADPTHPEAVELYFGVLTSPDPPPKEQQELQAGIATALRVCRQRFLDDSAPQVARFRIYFIRLFRIAQIGLQGERPLTAAAGVELAHLAVELDAVPNAAGSAQAANQLRQAAPVPGVPVPKGAYIVWVADAAGNLIDPPAEYKPGLQPDPGNPLAVNLLFGLPNATEPPPKDQSALQIEIAKVLRACRRLYLDANPPRPAKFRIYYTRLFRLAQLGLQGENPQPEVAATALATVISDLIDDEGGAIKNGYLVKLGRYVCIYSAVPLALYALLHVLPVEWTHAGLERLKVDLNLLSCFLLLWIGCFAGVWLSYGIRKTQFSLADLTNSDQDRLAPHIRLLFAGLLTMLIGILIAFKLIDLSIGSVSLSDITKWPLLAFLVGAFCGISELSLPVSISNRASTIIKP
jgi:hypothetical protein